MISLHQEPTKSHLNRTKDALIISNSKEYKSSISGSKDQRLNISRCQMQRHIYIYIFPFVSHVLDSLIPSTNNQVGLFLCQFYRCWNSDTVKLSNLLNATEPGNGRARIQTTQDHWLQSPHSSPAKVEITKVNLPGFGLNWPGLRTDSASYQLSDSSMGSSVHLFSPMWKWG